MRTNSTTGLTRPALPGTSRSSCGLDTLGSSSAVTSVARMATYRTTSPTVRRSPEVNGTLSGHGAMRMVPGRAQYRKPPVMGLKWPAIGPHEPATPIVSSSTVQRTNFWYTMGSDHHDATSQNGWMPEVSVATSTPPKMYSMSSFTM